MFNSFFVVVVVAVYNDDFYNVSSVSVSVGYSAGLLNRSRLHFNSFTIVIKSDSIKTQYYFCVCFNCVMYIDVVKHFLLQFCVLPRPMLDYILTSIVDQVETDLKHWLVA